MPPSVGPPTLIVSFVEADRAAAEQIAAEFTQAGHRVRLLPGRLVAPSSAAPAGTFDLPWIAVLSPAYLAGLDPATAFTANRTPLRLGRPGWLVAVRVAPGSLPVLAPGDRTVDFAAADRSDRLREAVAAIVGAHPSGSVHGGTAPPAPRWRQAVHWVNSQSGMIQIALGVLSLLVAVVACVLPVVLTGGNSGGAAGGDSGDGSHTVSAKPVPSSMSPQPAVTLDTATAVLVSADAAGRRGNQPSGRPSISADGRFVAFTSAATNLVSGVTGGFQIYRKDLLTGAIDLISRGVDGRPGNGDNQFPSICRNGRYVLFAATSSNLVSVPPGPPDVHWQVFVRDTLDATTHLVSATPAGRPGAGDSVAPAMSADCTTVVFDSDAADLVPGDSNGTNDVFAKRFTEQRITLVSRTASGGAADDASFGADVDPTGATISFTSAASNLPDARPGQLGIYVSDAGRIRSASAAFAATAADDVGGFSWPTFSPDGRYLAFRSLRGSDPENRGRHMFVWDVKRWASAITGLDGRPAGWHDACIDGTSNGTRFAPGMSGTGGGDPYRIIFTVGTGTDCTLVLRDLNGTDVPLRARSGTEEIIEPAIDAAGATIAWAAGDTGAALQVYACYLPVPGQPATPQPHRCPS